MQKAGMPKTSAADEIKERLAGFSDPGDARFLKGFFKTGPGQYGEGDIFRGIRVPVLRKLSRAYQGIPLEDAEELLHSAHHEDRLLALFILVLKYRSGDEAGRTALYKLYLGNTRFINNWDLVDASAPYIVGAYLSGTGRAPLCRMARSRSLWERRIAVLATFYFIRQNDYHESLRIAEILLKDKEDLIHKAVGWMLREIGKRDLRSLECFLGKHCYQMPRTMLRYAIERFPEDKRLHYLGISRK